MTNFAEWLQAEMSARQLSQADLSRRSGLSATQITNVLSGNRQPGKATCKGIARAFGIPDQEVFIRAGMLDKPKEWDAEIEEMAEMFKVLSKEDRDNMLAMARAMLNRHRARSTNAATKSGNGRKIG